MLCYYYNYYYYSYGKYNAVLEKYSILKYYRPITHHYRWNKKTIKTKYQFLMFFYNTIFVQKQNIYI